MSGFCNIGDLMLRKIYKHLEKNREDVELDRKHYTPEVILEKVKQGTLTIQATENSDEKSCSDLQQKQTKKSLQRCFHLKNNNM